MSNTKIVIDKDDFYKLMKLAKTVCVNELNIPRYTLVIDSSINERAVKFSTNNLAQQSYSHGCKDQQIIEQLKVKEKECKPSPIDYYEKGFEEEKEPSFD